MPDTPLPPSVDRLSPLLDRFRVRAQLFHTGALCGVSLFEQQPGRAFLHVLRRGEMEVVHTGNDGLAPRLIVDEPTLLFYPRAITHAFHNPPVDGSDFTCATLRFDGDEHNPLVQALPSLILLPLRQVTGLEQTLNLLFAETDRSRCGSRLLADRLFEVVLIQLLRWLIDHPDAAGISSGLVAGLSDPRLARALAAIHAQPGDDWTLAAMATKAGMSRAAFAAGFKQATGQTPASYLSDWRLSLAIGELRAGQPIKVIADALGYSGAPAFSKAFKQRFGAAPRDWLREATAA
ncbi:AraC family transcriptional regulator [Jeongeupia naejangsanensis]|uniref:AraC family transcriptional regulator n=1 Tax=Jeongeupia naejangsanensis TaxID=613195 RepID=A0ABS2BP30_9NEIS|nr:AraC family transcriptional regulator [Jeongeupia naejangsanensis]MBM3116813.1 AraC family transcriptional regulator [Jeongeupia naejangsanensis]